DLFKSHLAQSPLLGRVSAGQARRTLARGMDRLDDLIAINKEPTEANHSEFEIIAKQIADEEARVKRVNYLAETLGSPLDAEIEPLEPTTTDAAVEQPGAGARAPAQAKRKPASAPTAVKKGRKR